jgi:asparagine synthase (glutamine-hydrolysing)
MCGIVGFYNTSSIGSFGDPHAYLFSAQESISHRGPNGYRIWLSKNNNFGVAHRRLSILDLSQAGFQPMFDKDHTVAVCCNGEIYNYPALRNELERLGYVFTSTSDTEVIVYAYKQWGIDCLKKLDGMFALVIFDISLQECFLVRDRIGIKPFYFSLQKNILAFASEIKALWHFPWIEKKLNKRAMYHYVSFLASPAPLTLYDGVYKLPAGYYMHMKASGEYSFHEWYNPVAHIQNHTTIDEKSCVEKLDTLLNTSVEKHLASDVPYGAFLSGGLDSSLIVAYMACYTHNIKTFNVSFSDNHELDERIWAHKVSRLFNTQHHEITIDEKDAFNFFQRMTEFHDEPLADCVSIPLYYVSTLLKKEGVSVVLSGEGADELFCGYSTYARYVHLYTHGWQFTQKYLPTVIKKNLFFAAKLFMPRINDTKKSLLHTWKTDRHLFWSGALAFHEYTKKDFLYDYARDEDAVLKKIFPHFSQEHDSYALVDYYLKKLYKHYPQADFLSSIIYLDLKHRLSDLLLMRLDKMTMANSLEGRVPFLDHHLVEYALSLPSHYKLRNGTTKYILKKVAEKKLPLDIIYRKKIGFGAPTDKWFKKGTYFKPYFQDLLASKKTTWNTVLNMPAIERLHKDHIESDNTYATQLWTLQNLLASDLAP